MSDTTPPKKDRDWRDPTQTTKADIPVMICTLVFAFGVNVGLALIVAHCA